MLNRQSLALLFLAIGLGLLATIVANRWLQEQIGESGKLAKQVEPDTLIVLVADREVPYGSTIEEMHLREVKWPKDLAPEGTFDSPEQVLGRIANQKLIEGEPLLDGKVVDKLDGSTLSSLITEDKRAITVRVNDVIGVAGFLQPGNRVDVLATRKDRQSGRAISRTALENLKVLAVDQSATPDKDQAVVVRAVTLEASLKESVVLVAATEEGTVQLVLRNPKDAVEPQLAAARRVVKPKAPTSTNIEIIRGMDVSKTRVRL